MKKETGFLIRNIAVRRILIWATQAGIFAASALAAFLLRFDFSVPAFYFRYIPYALAIWLPLKFVVFYAAKLDRGFWRYLSAIDLIRISAANITASLIGFFFIRWLAPPGFPRSLYVLDLMVSFFGTCGLRLLARATSRFSSQNRASKASMKRTLIYGAGDAGVIGQGTLDLAVRATAALAAAYIQRRDRVGLIGFGGILRWLTPGGGIVQLHRIVDALLDTEVVLSYYWKEIDLIPRRVLPAKALVIALSPLLDQRSVGALVDLRARGFDIAVIEVSPIPYAPQPKSSAELLAFDIWLLRRDALRHRLRSAGIAVTEWRSDASLQAHLEEVREFRRHGRLARV